MATNKGEDVDLISLVLLDPETGKIEPVESDPEKRVDFGGASFSELTDELHRHDVHGRPAAHLLEKQEF